MNRIDREMYYGGLLNEHTKISNQISEIKGSTIELTEEQKATIITLQKRQVMIINEIQKILMSK